MWKNIFVLALVIAAVVSDDTCSDPNSSPHDCSLNCLRRCSNYLKGKTPICPRIQCPPGCGCKDKYYYDEKTGLCVLPWDCTC
ncbi:uncharacterized protein [Choristoneura fumiferana]|uniref:uncharacterized protein n=1 Tax=Choristoneura fumiferana TaxID=7141 RepID=UPI003D156CD9